MALESRPDSYPVTSPYYREFITSQYYRQALKNLRAWSRVTSENMVDTDFLDYIRDVGEIISCCISMQGETFETLKSTKHRPDYGNTYLGKNESFKVFATVTKEYISIVKIANSEQGEILSIVVLPRLQNDNSLDLKNLHAAREINGEWESYTPQEDLDDKNKIAGFVDIVGGIIVDLHATFPKPSRPPQVYYDSITDADCLNPFKT